MSNTRKPDVALPKIEIAHETPVKNFLKNMFFYHASINRSPTSQKDLSYVSLKQSR